jgi:hypothetical protein
MGACQAPLWRAAGQALQTTQLLVVAWRYLSGQILPPTREGRQGIAAVPQAKEDCPAAQAGRGTQRRGLSFTLWRSATGMRFLTPSRMCPKRKKNAQLLEHHAHSPYQGVSMVPDMAPRPKSALAHAVQMLAPHALPADSHQNHTTLHPAPRSELCQGQLFTGDGAALAEHAITLYIWVRECASGQDCRRRAPGHRGKCSIERWLEGSMGHVEHSPSRLPRYFRVLAADATACPS